MVKSKNKEVSKLSIVIVVLVAILVVGGIWGYMTISSKSDEISSLNNKVKAYQKSDSNVSSDKVLLEMQNKELKKKYDDLYNQAQSILSAAQKQQMSPQRIFCNSTTYGIGDQYTSVICN